jgi:hypothetical protein
MPFANLSDIMTNNNSRRRGFVARIRNNKLSVIVFLLFACWVVLFVKLSSLLSSNHHPGILMEGIPLRHNNTTPTRAAVVRKQTLPVSSSTTQSNTKIIGFTDVHYQEIAVQWYRELENLGYSEHWIVAQDQQAYEYLRHTAGIPRVDFLGTLPTCNDPQLSQTKAKQHYRRMLFASRWNYLLRQLLLPHAPNILLTDVDNIFTNYRNLQALDQQQDTDVYHAYAGTMGSFPRNLFQKYGFTVCGGMSWWRGGNHSGVIDFVRHVVHKCHCERFDNNCDCACDDQVVLNNILFQSPKYAIVWNNTTNTNTNTTNHQHQLPPQQVVGPPKELEDLDWTARLTGVCNQTGHRVQLWDRYSVYRAPLNAKHQPKFCPPRDQNWIAMPSRVDDKIHIREMWKAACGG